MGMGADGYILIILKICASKNSRHQQIFTEALKLLLWENVNYLINRAKSCYENFDNDNKMRLFHQQSGAREDQSWQNIPQLID